MKGHPSWFLVALLLSTTACSEAATQNVVTTVNDVAPVRLSDFEDPAAMEDAIVGFAQCVEKRFPIVVRFRPDAFIGLTTEVTSQRQEDGELVDSVTATCNGMFDLDRRISAYQESHPISAQEDLGLAQGFVSCASAISPTISDLVAKAHLISHTSVAAFVAELTPGQAGLTASELTAMSDCESNMTGPERVFSQGHLWFTP
jgi:hypothetical protein